MEQPDNDRTAISPATLHFIYDDGGYRASGVVTAGQPPVVRAIAICLGQQHAYRLIHGHYVALLAAQGFTPAGRVSARWKKKHGSGSPSPALERRLKCEVCEDLLSRFGFESRDLRARPVALQEAHRGFGDCVAQFRDRKGNTLFAALVDGALREIRDLRRYRWDRERISSWDVGQATRADGTVATEMRYRKAVKVWVPTTSGLGMSSSSITRVS